MAEKPRFGTVKTRKEMREALISLLRENGVPDKVSEVLNLDNKEDLKAIGVGLMAAGYTGREAAAQLGIKESTIRSNYYRILGPGVADRPNRRRESEERIEAAASGVAEAALAEMASDLEREDVRLTPADKAKYFGAGNKALERVRGRISNAGEGDGDMWAKIAAKMGEEGGTIKVDVEPRKLVEIPCEVIEDGGESDSETGFSD